MDNFENMFEENDNEILKMEQEAQRQSKMEEIRDQLARANYNAIIKHGIDIESIGNVEAVKGVIGETLQYFENLEEYEKCAKLKSVLDSF